MRGSWARGRLVGVAVELWLVVVILGLWWVLSASSRSTFFPPLKTILQRTAQLWVFNQTISDLVPSLVNLLAGFFIALVVGVTVGMLLGSMPALLNAVEPELEFLRAIPAVALLPIAIIAIGLGDNMRIAVIAVGAVWPILMNTIAGARSVDPVQRDVAAAFAVSRRTNFFVIRLPAAAPQIFAGARTSLSIAVVLVVVSEIEGAHRGVGYFLLASQRNYAITNMWTGMVVLGVVGYVLNLLFRIVEARVLRWHPTYRSTNPRTARRPRTVTAGAGGKTAAGDLVPEGRSS